MPASICPEDEPAEGDLADKSGALPIANPDAEGERAQRPCFTVIESDHGIERVNGRDLCLDVLPHIDDGKSRLPRREPFAIDSAHLAPDRLIAKT